MIRRKNEISKFFLVFFLLSADALLYGCIYRASIIAENRWK